MIENISIPLSLTCKVTGITRKFTNRAWLEKKANEYGSLQAFKDNYVCREAKALTKGKTPEAVLQIKAQGLEAIVGITPIMEKIQEIVAEQQVVEKMDFKIGTHVPLTKETTAKDACLNPGWYLDENPCEQCVYFEICSFTRKRIAKVK